MVCGFAYAIPLLFISSCGAGCSRQCVALSTARGRTPHESGHDFPVAHALRERPPPSGGGRKVGCCRMRARTALSAAMVSSVLFILLPVAEAQQPVAPPQVMVVERV